MLGPGHVSAQLGTVGVRCAGFKHQLAVVNDHDTVCQAQQFVKVFTEQQDRCAAVASVDQALVNERDTGEVQTEYRVGDDQHRDVVGQFTGQYSALYVASGQGADRPVRVVGRYLKLLNQAACLDTCCATIQAPALAAERRLVEIAQGQVVSHAECTDAGVAQGFFGQAEHAQALHLFTPRVVRLAVDRYMPGAEGALAEQRFGQFMYGYFPNELRWRVDLTAILAIVGAAPLFISKFPRKAVYGITFLVIYPVVAFYLLHGGAFGLTNVPTSQWGGLMLTLVIATVGIVGALPLGILLALGRRSNMPAVRVVCVTFIEFWRGVPLITVLFMSSVMLPLFMPEGMNFDKLLRALIGVILFQSAYIAEVVRGGMQAIPKGQYEAASAMGLGYWRSMGLVILPQALKMVIPGIVNTFIALFKDTSLVIIIGLFDLLNSVKQATADPAWLGMATEGYVFAALVFWIFCFGMSRYSMHLERKLDTGHKR
ncbi:Polar amino acid ABC-type transport system, permease protein [Pseudomonas syringae pv. atrofaciens]|nr:Polar amino acid ABC-type transport system, permease protein [Pseudomonas syringae pv. atrofaciens]